MGVNKLKDFSAHHHLLQGYIVCSNFFAFSDDAYLFAIPTPNLLSKLIAMMMMMITLMIWRSNFQSHASYFSAEKKTISFTVCEKESLGFGLMMMANYMLQSATSSSLFFTSCTENPSSQTQLS